MKVVHIFWSLTFGGIETMLVNIANAQTREGAEVSVIIINDLYDESLVRSFNDKVKLVFLHRKLHSHSLVFMLKVNQALKHLNPDVIHLHSSRIYKVIFDRNLKGRVLVTLHDLPKGAIRPSGLFYRIFPFLSVCKPGIVRFIDEVPRIISISEAVKKSLWENYGIPSSVICNGIRTTDFAIRKQAPCSSPLQIVQVSRLAHEKKGQDLLIQAIAQLNGRAEAYFIGEGGSLEYLKKLAAELGVENYVHFLGKKTQQDIARSLCEYDLFVQPSRNEGFGLTVAEAMAAQVPVLVSSGQGPAEVTCNTKYGWVFENGNVDDLTRILDYICEHYDDALDKAITARRHVIGNYDVAVTARMYLKEYME